MIMFIIEESQDYVNWSAKVSFDSKKEQEAFNHFHYLCNEFPTMGFRLIKIQTAIIASN